MTTAELRTTDASAFYRALARQLRDAGSSQSAAEMADAVDRVREDPTIADQDVTLEMLNGVRWSDPGQLAQFIMTSFVAAHPEAIEDELAVASNLSDALLSLVPETSSDLPEALETFHARMQATKPAVHGEGIRLEGHATWNPFSARAVDGGLEITRAAGSSRVPHRGSDKQVQVGRIERRGEDIVLVRRDDVALSKLSIDSLELIRQALSGLQRQGALDPLLKELKQRTPVGRLLADATEVVQTAKTNRENERLEALAVNRRALETTGEALVEHLGDLAVGYVPPMAFVRLSGLNLNLGIGAAIGGTAWALAMGESQDYEPKPSWFAGSRNSAG